MSMTERKRMLAVYRGELPDRVPFYLDLSHWFAQRSGAAFDLSVDQGEPAGELLEYHRKAGVGFYLPNLCSFIDVSFPEDVRCTTVRSASPEGTEIRWRIETPLGAIERARRWEEKSYSWCISRWGVATDRDLRILAFALGRQKYAPRWDRFREWVRAVGENGVVYVPMGYSGMGHLLAYWMGIERTLFAAVDMRGTLHEVVDEINQNFLECVDVACQGPAQVILLGDNFSSDVQPPRFFSEWSAPFYREAFRRIRAKGKFAAVHVDGRLKGLLGILAELGASCIDAVTPAPMGDLSPAECRKEAGPDMVLSGGVPPNLWMKESGDREFRQSVRSWLETRTASPRLIANAGDQVPPGAPEYRIEMMRELVEKHGTYAKAEEEKRAKSGSVLTGGGFHENR